MKVEKLSIEELRLMSKTKNEIKIREDFIDALKLTVDKLNEASQNGYEKVKSFFGYKKRYLSEVEKSKMNVEAGRICFELISKNAELGVYKNRIASFEPKYEAGIKEMNKNFDNILALATSLKDVIADFTFGIDKALKGLATMEEGTDEYINTKWQFYEMLKSGLEQHLAKSKKKLEIIN
jgi:hypothetical protein